MQTLGFVALLVLGVGAGLTASGAYAGNPGNLVGSEAAIADAPALANALDPCDPVWSVVSSPNVGTSGNQLNGVAAVSANDVWAVGYYSNDSNIPQTLVEHWDGTAWSVVSSANLCCDANYLQAVAAVSANDVWAVGYYYTNNSISRTLIEHWDGTAWSVVSSPNPVTSQNFLYGVAAVSANDVWAVGNFTSNSGSSYHETLVEHWDGTAWSVVPSPNVGTNTNGLNGVAAVSADDVWAVGYYSNGSVNQTLVEHYASPCGTPTNTPTMTLTPSITATPTSTPTGTIAPVGLINGHLTWESIPQPDARNSGITATLYICNGSNQVYLGLVATDQNGNFTVETGLADGSYTWRIKNVRSLRSAGSMTIVGGTSNQEFGTMRAGDCNDTNTVNSQDYTTLHGTYGKAPGNPAYDARANFNRDGVVNAQDFTLLKRNFGRSGAGTTCP